MGISLPMAVKATQQTALRNRERAESTDIAEASESSVSKPAPFLPGALWRVAGRRSGWQRLPGLSGSLATGKVEGGQAQVVTDIYSEC